MASGATKRIAASAVDWARYAAVVPKAQTESLRIIKAKHDTFINKVYSLPESLPKINFASYKNRLPDPTMADRFQKAYETLSVPYPKDKDNLLQKVEEENQEIEKKTKAYVAELSKTIASSKLFLEKINSLPKPDEFTPDMYSYYFPDTALDPAKPSIWPHKPEEQPSNPNFEYIK
ncbi:ATP synthase subunit d mitochondrial [Biomphalaria pfeifferi]|uniref:ATP synthase subunit d, mitochondrial n=1 Tax=Biomphalaria pfeifferi TaxID=112525 RepID=A0AAD8AW02_BIOPF|nr:ATP synthase subunit d mitochondrial [Biomphalaria pfeifferi]